MADDTTLQTDQSVSNLVATGATTATGNSTQSGNTTSDGVVIDKTKTSEQYIEDVKDKYIVPRVIREKFTDLIKLIYETESMDQEEREYWLQIMPIMTEDQIKKFRDILVNERDQLAKLDQEYKSGSGIQAAPAPPIDEKALQEKMEKIKKEEAQTQEVEVAEEEALLEELKGMDQ